MTDYRKGSMGAADQRNMRLGIIVFSVIFLICYLLWIVPSNLYSHYYFSHAGTGWKVVGFISIIAHYLFLFLAFKNVEEPAGSKGFKSVALLFGWFALNILLLSGFNFSLPG